MFNNDNYITQIILIVSGLITTIGGWHLGKKQNIKNQTTDTIASGADSLVSTLKELLEIANENMKHEREIKLEERKHRTLCEENMKKHDALIESMRKEINTLKKQVKR